MKRFSLLIIVLFIPWNVIVSQNFFDFFSKRRSSGWIDANTYSVVADGKASGYSLHKNSFSMKKTTCIDSSKLNALSSMISDVSNGYVSSYKIKSPPVWVRSCWSIKNNFEECACKVTFQEKNLKQKLESKFR